MSGYRYWRVVFKRWEGGGAVGRTGYFNVGKMRFAVGSAQQPTAAMTAANAPSPYVVSASSTPNNGGYAAFGGTYGLWGPSGSGVPEWLQFDAGADYAFDSITYAMQSDYGRSHYILDFDILASATGAFSGEEVTKLTYTTAGTSTTMWSAVYPAGISFTIPVVAGGAGQVNANLASLVAVSLGHGFDGAAIALPSLTASAQAGTNAIVSLPALLSSAWAGSNANVSLPSLNAHAAVLTSVASGVAASLPSLQASGQSGANASAQVPAVATYAAATFYGWVQASLLMPEAVASASGTSGVVGGSSISMPMFGTSSQAGSNAAASMPPLSAQGGSTVGSVAAIAVALPSLQVGLGAALQSRGRVAVILPALRATNSGVVQVTLPALQALVSAYAVIAYTFEAYAINLSHKPKVNEAAIDEVTRYTNYPFDKIVRYKNSYYGVTATGLFLLGGNTDFAEPTPTAIPWDWKTAIDDFNSVQKKTLISAYFSGRIAHTATVSLYVGEKGAESYSYASPRGPDIQNFRQVFGRGIKARYYALGANGTGVFELDTIDFDTSTLTRRI